MVNRKSGKAPVVLAQGLPMGRRRRRGRAETLDAQALAAPVPGELLVLLSRLHRREETSSAPPSPVGSGDPQTSDLTALSPHDPNL